ncbi:MAG: hypothetical protein R6W66_09005 [Pelovirga sp.]
MKIFAFALLAFLLAFVGLGIGLLTRGRRLRGGCGHDRDACSCKKADTSDPPQDADG